MNVVTALAIKRLIRAVQSEHRAFELQQVKHALDISVKSVIALSGKYPVSIFQIKNRLLGVNIQRRFTAYTGACRIFTVVADVIQRCGNTLVIGRHI